MLMMIISDKRGGSLLLFLVSYSYCTLRHSHINENLIPLKNKPAKNGSARLGSALPQHVAKNILVKEERWDGAATGREGGRNCSYEQHLRFDWCKPEAVTNLHWI